MNGSELYIDKTVKITFGENWAIPSATYVYEGFDPHGHWVRSKSGRQRYLQNIDVAAIEIVEATMQEEAY